MAYVGLGVTGADVVKYAGKALDYATQAKDYGEITKYVLEDPALPQVKALVAQLRAIEVARAPKGVAPDKVKGIGLQAGVYPLQAFVAYRERPWLLPVALAAIFAVPFYLGRASK